MARVSMDSVDLQAGLDILRQLSKKWQVVDTTTAFFQKKLSEALATVPFDERQSTWKEISDRQINGSP